MRVARSVDGGRAYVEPIEERTGCLSLTLHVTQPINIQLASPHLTVSSLLHASLLFLSPPRAVSIILISGQISQTFAVYYNDGKVALPPPIRHVMAKVDLTAHHAPLVPTPSRPAHVPGPNGLTNAAAPVDPIRHDPRPLHQLEREQEYTYTTLYRIPTDDLVRPSTLPETNTRIRVTHHLVLEIRYRREGETEDHQLTISRPIVIASVSVGRIPTLVLRITSISSLSRWRWLIHSSSLIAPTVLLSRLRILAPTIPSHSLST